VQTLETEHLKLVPFSLELKKATITERARMASMLGVHVPDSWPGPDMTEALPFFVETMEKDAVSRVWDGIIIHKVDQVAIGGVGFHGGPDEAGMVEIGYNIIPEYQGRGYATEMTRSFIDWAFHTQGIQLITAECLDDNIGSIRVLEKVGMCRLEPEGKMLKWELRK
jgi:[ribosomal protein S5]-alanine N-acetyltransferase